MRSASISPNSLFYSWWLTGDAEWIYYELDDKHVQYMHLLKYGRIRKHLMHLHVHVYYREGIHVYVLSWSYTLGCMSSRGLQYIINLYVCCSRKQQVLWLPNTHELTPRSLALLGVEKCTDKTWSKNNSYNMDTTSYAKDIYSDWNWDEEPDLLLNAHPNFPLYIYTLSSHEIQQTWFVPLLRELLL